MLFLSRLYINGTHLNSASGELCIVRLYLLYKSLVNLSIHLVRGTLFNFFCRSGSLLAKFLLVIYISKAMSLETLGLYNIVSVTVAWSVYVLGFEFYSFSLRQIVGENSQKISGFVFNQLVFHMFGFVLLAAISPLLVAFGFIPSSLLVYFVIITFFDQLSQECYRICIALERSQFANFLHFVKSGLWVYPLLVLPVFHKDVTIQNILFAWVSGTFFALVIGIFKLVRLDLIRLERANLDFAWIKRGVIVAFPFLVISVAQLTMDFSDRYFIDYFLGKADVGVYSFYYGIANVPTTLITSVLVATYYPKVINVYKFNRPSLEIRILIRNFLWQSMGLAILISVMAIVLVHALLDFIGKQQLLQEINLFYLMLFQVVIFSIQVVIQTVLYARHEDRFLLYSAVAGGILNIVLNVLLIPRLGINGAALSTILSMGVMLGLRLFLLNKSKHANENG